MSFETLLKGKDSTGTEQVIATDTSGRTTVVGTGTFATQNTPAAFSFLNIQASIASTLVKTGAGTLHSITLNSAALASNTTTIYDSVAGVGNTIALIAAATATVPTTLIFDAAFTNGLSVVTAVATSGDMTLNYI